jgi:hypothetical protein
MHKHTKWTPEIVKEWREMLKQRDAIGRPVHTLKSIAAIYNTNYQVITRKLEQYGI